MENLLFKVKIGTRGSQLAIWQANFIASKLAEKNIDVEIVKVQTQGDKILDAPLAKIGGKGLFTKELERQLSDGKINIAVHSLKDVPTELDAAFKIAAITKRENPFDAFVSNKFSNFDELPEGAIIGTSSLRRAAQILMLRPDLQIKNLRGNVDTRLKKLDANEFDAIILAAAGLKRLGHGERIRQTLTQIIPAAGQGALAVEIRADDEKTFDAIKFLNDFETCAATKIERDFLQVIGGGCQIPVGIYAAVDGEKISARAVIASIDGKNFVKDFATDTLKNIDDFGKNFAEKLLSSGGAKILLPTPLSLLPKQEVINFAYKNSQ
ncbi:MAG: hydroxymethylbilane synthase [Selenomonadaceae bacterium]|nr:hydroxymethylbilane synthase [Selenomonadaceae bacterium]